MTRILNNVIEHSVSPKCRIMLALGPYDCRFRIRDFGTGLFSSVSSSTSRASSNSGLKLTPL